MIKTQFKSLLNKHEGRKFLICCPGKNFIEWLPAIKKLPNFSDLITIGSNKISELVNLNYHMFTNNDKYSAYGGIVNKNSVLMLGSSINKSHIKKHRPHEYINLQYTDRDKLEPISYDNDKDLIKGYYRTSGNIAIMLCHLMGSENIYIAGMCGFTYKFDGQVHYYKAEINRDKKTKKEWRNRYDKPVSKSLDNLKKFGIKFSIITPTIYNNHYNQSILEQNYV